MNILNYSVFLTSAIITSYANASEPNDLESHFNWIPKTPQIYIDCNKSPERLKQFLTVGSWFTDNIVFKVSGECQGPLLISRDGIEIKSADPSIAAVITQPENSVEPLITIQGRNINLDGLTIDSNGLNTALLVNSASLASFNNLKLQSTQSVTSHQSIHLSQNSTLNISNLKALKLKISGNSYLELGENNHNHTLTMYDNASTKSLSSNSFEKVEISGSSHFLADEGSHVENLFIWSKAVAILNNQSSAKHVEMGGQTLFGAYEKSIVEGPYWIWGNVVFEVDNATLLNWKKQDKPQSIIQGKDATVNGIFHEGWSWDGTKMGN